MRTFIGIIFLLGFLPQLLAQEENLSINADRPGQCYATTTVPKGYFQLETGLGFDLLQGMNNWNLSATDFRYGIANNFELRTGVRTNIIQQLGTAELAFDGALTAGLKWGIVNKKVQLIYLVEAYIPAYPTVVNAHHLLGLAHPVGKRVGFNYMLLHRYDFAQLQTPNYGGGLQFSYAASFSLLKKLTFYLEFTGFWDSASPQAYQILYDAGFMYLVKDNIQLDVFFGTGINYKHTTYGIGISCLLLKKKEK